MKYYLIKFDDDEEKMRMYYTLSMTKKYIKFFKKVGHKFKVYEINEKEILKERKTRCAS